VIARYMTFTGALLVLVVVVSSAMPASRNDGPPASIASIGDSITAGTCTDPTCAERPGNSWSTGTNPAVDSHLLRLRAIFKNKVKVHAFSFATNAHVTMYDFPGQAREAARTRAQYVTVEIGENDLCDTTAAASFRSSLDRGLNVLSGSGHATKILLLSIENIAAHWRALRSDPTAMKALKAGAVLDCGLGYNTATPALLAKVQARAVMLNRILADVCSEHPLCLYDGGTYFRLRLKASDFSPADYQHLSLAGQHALAAAEWKVALKILYQ
jgi:GDSL-like Lipase/Acylhydrolase family